MDSTTKARLPFATVQILEPSRGVSANVDGFYLIPGVPSGIYDVAASYVGYERKIKRVTIQAGKAVTVDFDLAQQPLEQQEVTIIGNALSKVQQQNVSVHLIQQSDIRLVPVAVQEDVFRSLQILPGIVSTSDVTSQFHVRGGAGDQNLILLDGMRIFGPYHALGLFSVFDTDIIQTTELYAGAYPPGFGGRLSSVVNFSARDARRDRVGVKASANLLSSKLLAEVPLSDNLRVLVNGRSSISSDAYRKFLKTDIPLSFYDAFTRLTWEGDESHTRVNLQSLFTDDVLKSSNPDEPDYGWKNKAVGVSASSLLQDRLFMKVDVFSSTYEAQRTPKLSTATPATTSVEEAGMRINATVYGESDNLYNIGFEMLFLTVEAQLVNLEGASQQLSSHGVEGSAWFRVQSSWDELKTDIGVHTDLAGILTEGRGLESFEPRFSLSYAVVSDWRFKLAYGRFSQKILTINNEDDLISVFDTWIHVPEGLKPEQADHYVAGLDGTLFESIGTGTQVYYKSYNSIVVYNRDKVGTGDADYINGTGESYGVETLLRYGSKDINLYGAYTLSWTTLKTGGFTYHPRYDRRHSLNLLARYSLAENVHLTARWEFGSGLPFTQAIGAYNRLEFGSLYPDDYGAETGVPYTVLGDKNAARLPTYHRLDVSLGYRFGFFGTEGNLGLHVINLYDRKNPFYFDRRTGRRVDMLPFFPSATLQISY